MTSLTVPFLKEISHLSSLDQVASLLADQPRQKIQFAPWATYPYKPEVSFAIAYCAGSLLLHYNVQEKHIRAVNTAPNSPVWQDSCVELFIAFGGEPAYYNFEFNCIGACLAGYGEGRNDRQPLPVEDIRLIRYKAQSTNEGQTGAVDGDKTASAGKIISNTNTPTNTPNLIHWQLTLLIPFTAFHHHHITSLSSSYARANFYKCGDELPEPHFLSWSNIESSSPDFHLPQFFGQLHFAKSDTL